MRPCGGFAPHSARGIFAPRSAGERMRPRGSACCFGEQKCPCSGRLTYFLAALSALQLWDIQCPSRSFSPQLSPPFPVFLVAVWGLPYCWLRVVVQVGRSLYVCAFTGQRAKSVALGGICGNEMGRGILFVAYGVREIMARFFYCAFHFLWRGLRVWGGVVFRRRAGVFGFCDMRGRRRNRIGGGIFCGRDRVGSLYSPKKYGR